MTNTSTVGAGLGPLVCTRGRLALVLVTLVIGAVTALGLPILLPRDQLLFTRVAPLVQLVMSVFTPFATAFLTSDVRNSVANASTAELPGRWIAAGIYGLGMGAYGAAISAVAISLATRSPVVDPWAEAAPTLLGCLIAQLIPVGVGCAAGLLIARIRRAQLATVVVPLGVSLVLPRFTPAGTTDWVTPLAAIAHLLPGPMTPLDWAQWVVTFALWVVLPNWMGARLLRPRTARRT